MLIIRNLNLISIQSWTYLLNVVKCNCTKYMKTEEKLAFIRWSAVPVY